MASIRNLIGKIGGRAVAPLQQGGRAGQPMIPPNAMPPATGGPNGPRALKLTNAALIYGVGALIIYALAFYHLATASWFNGLVLMVPATSLAFLGYRYMQ